MHQTVSWVRKNHNWKFGAEALHYRDDIAAPLDVSGAFYSPQAFVDGVISEVSVKLDYLANRLNPGDRFTGPVPSPDRKWHLRYNDLAWFVEDTWKVKRRLTLTPGLRWEYFGVQSSAGHERNRDINFYLGEGATYSERFANGKFLRTSEAPGEYRNHYTRPDRNNFGPRLGLALDVRGDGRTVVRAGAGVFFDATFGRVPPSMIGSVAFRDVPFTEQLLENPYAISGNAVSEPPTIERVDPDRRTSYTSAWNATIEHEFDGKVVLSGSYVGSSSTALDLLVIENGSGSGGRVGRPGERLLNNYGDFHSVKSVAHSSYHSLQLNAEARQMRSRGLQIRANYTWGHSIDNASARQADGWPVGPFLDPANLRLDRGHSSFDQRHRFVTYFVWELPLGRRGSNLVSHLAGGWQFSGIVSLQTGLPFLLIDGGSVDEGVWARPRVTGPLPAVLSKEQMIPDPRVPNRFLYLAANNIRSFLGGACIPNATPFACVESMDNVPDDMLPRNYYRRPGSIYQDVALTKTFRVGERVSGRIRAEFYNVFNHANLEVLPGVPSYALNYPVFSSPAGLPSFAGRAGVIARYGGPPRQVVLAAKIVF